MKKQRPREIRLVGLQIKSIEKARKLARAVDIIEKELGIYEVLLTLEDCFICPEIDWRRFDRTPMQRHIRQCALTLLEAQNSKD
jgi:hypothetical protein